MFPFGVGNQREKTNGFIQRELVKEAGSKRFNKSNKNVEIRLYLHINMKMV